MHDTTTSKQNTMKEFNIQQSILLAFNRFGRIFRNNTAMAWAGNAVRLKNGDVLIKNARPLHAGLCVGSSDLIGFSTIEVTPDMVGRKIAIFTAIEVKQPKKKPTEQQAQFISTVTDMGGIAFVATSTDDVEAKINEYFNRNNTREGSDE